MSVKLKLSRHSFITYICFSLVPHTLAYVMSDSDLKQKLALKEQSIMLLLSKLNQSSHESNHQNGGNTRNKIESKSVRPQFSYSSQTTQHNFSPRGGGALSSSSSSSPSPTKRSSSAAIRDKNYYQEEVSERWCYSLINYFVVIIIIVIRTR